MEPRPIDRLMEAIYDAGVQVLRALEAHDFEAVVTCAHTRDALMAQLHAQDGEMEAARAVQLAQQHRLLADALQQAYDQLADALRRSDRYQQAAESYTEAAPPRHRLHARG